MVMVANKTTRYHGHAARHTRLENPIIPVSIVESKKRLSCKGLVKHFDMCPRIGAGAPYLRLMQVSVLKGLRPCVAGPLMRVAVAA